MTVLPSKDVSLRYTYVNSNNNVHDIVLRVDETCFSRAYARLVLAHDPFVTQPKRFILYLTYIRVCLCAGFYASLHKSLMYTTGQVGFSVACLKQEFIEPLNG